MEAMARAAAVANGPHDDDKFLRVLHWFDISLHTLLPEGNNRKLHKKLLSEELFYVVVVVVIHFSSRCSAAIGYAERLEIESERENQ